MYKMRLVRDRKWFFQYFPYHQMRMENEILKGWVTIHYLTSGECQYWEYEKAGRFPVSGEGMIWLTIIPDNASRCITTFFLPDRRISGWYVDVIEGIGLDPDGILYYVDKYLDVVMTPQGDVVVKDRDELDEAYESGELTTQQYENAIREGELIVQELGSDLRATEEYCQKILALAEWLIGGDRFTVFLDIDGVMDVFDPKIPVQEFIPGAVERLKNLIERTKGDVVIISDWRCGSPKYRARSKELGHENIIQSWDYLERTFEEAGIRIKGVTPWDEDEEDRTEEIKQYLRMNPDIKRYAIVDDCFEDAFESDEELRDHLVLVDAQKGLQDIDCLEACQIMNGIKE